MHPVLKDAFSPSRGDGDSQRGENFKQLKYTPQQELREIGDGGQK
jgi:hypothetical protein